MSELPTLASNNVQFIPPANVTTYQDCVAYALYQDSFDEILDWSKADFYQYTYNIIGESSLAAFARDIKKNSSTVAAYVRAARAFTPEERLPNISLSHHITASYTDEFDSKTGKFTTNNRFKWIAEAADNGWTIAAMRQAIVTDEKKRELNVDILPCDHCKHTEGEIFPYAIYPSGQGRRVTVAHLQLHPECYTTILAFIHHGYQKN